MAGLSLDALRGELYPPPLPPDLATPSAFAASHSRGAWRSAAHLELIERACLDAIATGGRLILSASVSTFAGVGACPEVARRISSFKESSTCTNRPAFAFAVVVFARVPPSSALFRLALMRSSRF